MSLWIFVLTVETEFDQPSKNWLGGIAVEPRDCCWACSVLFQLPEHGPHQTLVVQLAAGLSLGGHGAAAGLIEEDTKLQPILGD